MKKLSIPHSALVPQNDWVPGGFLCTFSVMVSHSELEKFELEILPGVVHLCKYGICVIIYGDLWGCAMSWAMLSPFRSSWRMVIYYYLCLLMQSCLFRNCHTYSSSALTPTDCKIFRAATPGLHQSAKTIRHMNLPCSEHVYDWQVFPGKIVNSFLSQNCSILQFFFSEFFNWIFSLHSCSLDFVSSCLVF